MLRSIFTLRKDTLGIRRGRKFLRLYEATLLVTLVAACSVLPLYWFGLNWRISPDSSWYLMQAQGLISGRGPTIFGVPQTVRGPILPGLIGLLMIPFGHDVEAMTWTVRLLALLNPLLMYLLVRRLSGPVAGIIAAGLVTFFGYTAAMSVSLNVDAVLLTAYLLSLISLLAAVQRGSALLSLLSGFLLGAAILTKETAVGGLPLAIFAALLLDWKFRGVLCHYLGLAVACLPWWAWVWAVSGEVYLVGKVPLSFAAAAGAASLLPLGLGIILYRSGLAARLLASERRRRMIAWSLAIAWTALLSVVLLNTSAGIEDLSWETARVTVMQVLKDTPGWSLLPLGTAYVVWKASREYRVWEFYAIPMVLQVPVCLLALAEAFNSRQFMLLQTLLLGSVAAFIVAVCGAVAASVESGTPPRSLIIPAVLLLSSLLVLGVYRQASDLLQGPTIPADNFNDDHIRNSIDDMSRWVAENIPEDEPILTSWWYSYQLAFFEGSPREWEPLELDCKKGGFDPPSRTVFL